MSDHDSLIWAWICIALLAIANAANSLLWILEAAR